MATFHFMNFGCRASQADGAALKSQLLQAGFEEAASIEKSHIAVLNTCTVTAHADAEVRQVIRRIHRANPACRVLVTGCYAQRAPREIAELPGVAWVVGNSHRHQVAAVLERDLGGQKFGPPRVTQKDSSPTLAPGARQFVPIQGAAFSDAQVLVGEISDQFHFAPVFPDDRTRPTLKIQDGCNARCSFCIIPRVRGRSRSLAPAKIIDQVRELVNGGFQEIVLSGINLGSYGKDLGPRFTFLGILEQILSETSVRRLRISSIEPMDVTPELVRLVAQEPRMAEHFHIPLQSGCDRILRLMNRRYWAAQYAERVLQIRDEIPNCGLGADVMVGFPGETPEDHSTSARFIRSLPFTYLHIFPYSSRPLTPAATFEGHLDGGRLRERSRALRSLMREKRQEFLKSQLGRTLSVLTLDATEEGTRVALSSNYLRVALPGSRHAANVLVAARVGRLYEELLYGFEEAL
jgi:threonylcarbamoyladenosine tRNA methylthiotransferase MtaB